MSALKRTYTNTGFKKRKGTKKTKSPSVSRAIFESKEETKIDDDSEWNAETIDTYTAPSYISNLMKVAQGVTQNTRAGNKIFLRRIYLKMLFEGSPSQSLQHIKVAVVKDLQPMAQYASALSAAALWYQIWQDTGNATQNLVAMTNLGFKDRFKIVKSVGLDLTPQGAYYDPVAANPRYVPTAKFLDLSIPVNEVITYQGSATADPVAGCNYYVFAWSDTNANTTKVWCNSRLYFNDA